MPCCRRGRRGRGPGPAPLEGLLVRRRAAVLAGARPDGLVAPSRRAPRRGTHVRSQRQLDRPGVENLRLTKRPPAWLRGLLATRRAIHIKLWSISAGGLYFLLFRAKMEAWTG